MLYSTVQVYCSCPAGMQLAEDWHTCLEDCGPGEKLVDGRCEDRDECRENPCSQVICLQLTPLNKY